jgi:hypothetical protein
MYNELKLEMIVQTLETLNNRIQERFPASGLGRVADDLVRIGRESGPLLDKVRKPNRWLRVGIFIDVLLIFALIGVFIYYLPKIHFVVGGPDIFQTIEAVAQDLVFLGLAIYFFATIETRIRRNISLRALRRLRSTVHIIDMHQLTKDPAHLLNPGMSTASSPTHQFTRFELARYLNYCSELLSLTSKLAALHAQYINDPIVLDAVNDIEVLASNLSNKIWQKIVILDTATLVQG